MRVQWLKWLREAGEGGLTWRSQVGANPIPIPHPTNLALFGHKITLHRFNQVGSYYCGGSNRSRGWAPSPGPLTLTTAYIQVRPLYLQQQCRRIIRGKRQKTRNQSTNIKHRYITNSQSIDRQHFHLLFTNTNRLIFFQYYACREPIAGCFFRSGDEHSE